MFGGDGESVIYPCHSLVVHMDIRTGTQRFYVGHTDKVGVGECLLSLNVDMFVCDCKCKNKICTFSCGCIVLSTSF